jgi:hypothetical protein
VTRPFVHATGLPRVCELCDWYGEPGSDMPGLIGHCNKFSHSPPRHAQDTCSRWKLRQDPPHVDPEAGA